MPPINSKIEYKIVVLGAGGVGKSSLTIRLVTGNFLTDYDPTIEDSYRKEVMVDGSACLLDILDTAGQEEYASLHEQWIRAGRGYLIVYSITSRLSFDAARGFYDKIMRAREGVLVGNKCDMVKERQVSTEMGQKMAREWGDNVLFFETSAKDRTNIEETFQAVARKIQQEERSSGLGKAKKKSSGCTIL